MLGQRVAVLDGAMGTMVQSLGLSEEDFHTPDLPSRARFHGLIDLLCITRPEVVSSIHSQYIEAGADIISTNSFNSNDISLAGYGLAGRAHELSRAAASLARAAADKAGRPVWVAGSMGPTAKSLSLADESTPSFDEMEQAYFNQALGLAEGGADLWLIETVFDALNAKAAISGCMLAAEQLGRELPVIISATLTEQGRTLAGQTLEAFVASVSHARPFALSLNCGFGAEGLQEAARRLSAVTRCAVGLYPNAGLPDALGCYDETPERMVADLTPLLRDRQLNLVGGCCGTTPAHIRALAQAVRSFAPRVLPDGSGPLLLSGRELLEVSRDGFVDVGERCNVAGSRKFLRLIQQGDLNGAVEVARAQVEAGAAVIDVNMDDPLLEDPVGLICRFVTELAADAVTGDVPVMVDSSRHDVILSALKHLPGRSVVNSISLKEGEAAMLDYARTLRRLGAVPVVMAFDEQGQADTYQRRISICERAYNLLTTRAGFQGEEIIFDPNILTVATGIPGHDTYALDFIRSAGWIREHLPGAHVSGGVSNLSFAYRGNEPVRRAMHSVFLHHAVAAGMDMAIVNPSALPPYDALDPELREAVEDVVLCRRPDAAERLTALAVKIKAQSDGAKSAVSDSPASTETAPEPADVMERLASMVVRGMSDGIEPVLEAAVAQAGSPLAVVEQGLMAGMNRVGELFGAGRMFLPQVVKSAGVMKCAVRFLTPLIQAGSTDGVRADAPTMVIATVKGDVHDIGKNIVTVVMKCNGFNMIDLGVMVPAETIVQRAIDEHADAIGLSGLITPSLDEMCRVATMMRERGLEIPLFVGGATTSAEHTAIRIAPAHGDAPTIHTRDAAELPVVARRFLVGDASGEIARLQEQQQELRDVRTGTDRLVSLDEARSHARPEPVPAPAPRHPGTTLLDMPVEEVVPYINWRAFLAVWGLAPSLASVADIDGCDHCRAQWLASQAAHGHAEDASRAMQLIKEAQRELRHLASDGAKMRAKVILSPAAADISGPDTITLMPEGQPPLVIPVLRQQSGQCRALSDWIAPEGDYAGLFAVTCGSTVQSAITQAQSQGDDYRALLLQSLADRLAEAATELMHQRVRTDLWGYEPTPVTPSRGIRPAFGYPSLPDQSLVLTADALLQYREIGITPTENGALAPPASTTGLILAHPQARYFAVGPVDSEQRSDYAARRGITPDELDRFLPAL